MNNKQRRMILCGFVVILLMGLFPPWKMYVVHPFPDYSGGNGRLKTMPGMLGCSLDARRSPESSDTMNPK